MATACSIVMANNPSALMSGPVGGIRAHTATSCILMTVSVVSICTLVVCGVLVVREYSLAMTYEPTTCRLSNVTYAKSDVVCMHCATGGSGEKASKEKGAGACVQTQFPCLLVFVLYPINNVSAGRRALLYQDSLQATGAYSQCSYSVCLRRHDDNKRAVEEFAARWRARHGQTFDCFYDTTDYSRVIVEKMYTQRDVIHSMTWPSLAVVVCGLVFLRLKTRRHRLTFCGRRTSGSDEIGDVIKKGSAGLGNNVSIIRDSAASTARSTPDKVRKGLLDDGKFSGRPLLNVECGRLQTRRSSSLPALERAGLATDAQADRSIAPVAMTSSARPKHSLEGAVQHPTVRTGYKSSSSTKLTKET